MEPRDYPSSLLSLSRGRVVVAVVDLTPQALLLLLEVSHLAVQVGHHLVVVLVVPLVGGVAVARARAGRGEHIVEELSEGDTEDGPGRQGRQEAHDGAWDQIEGEGVPVKDQTGHPVDWFCEVLILQQAAEPFHYSHVDVDDCEEQILLKLEMFRI